MKTLKLSIVVSLAVVLLFGCSRPGDVSKQTTVFGKISHLQGHPDITDYTLMLADYSGKATGYKGHVNADGTFKITFNQFIAQDVSLDHSVGIFIAHPGDSIHIDIDLDDRGSVKFTGDGAKTNTDINKYTGEYYSMNDKRPLPYTNATSSTYLDNYKAYCLNLREDMLKNMKDFDDLAEPNDETKAWIKSYVDIKYYDALLYGVVMYSYGSHLSPSEIAFPKGYFDMAGVENVEKSAILNSGYCNLAMMYSSVYLPSKIHFSEKTTEAILIDSVNHVLKGNELFRQLVLGYRLDMYMQKNDVDFYNSNKALYEPSLQAFVKQPLSSHALKIQADFKNVHANTAATLKDLSGTAAQTLIDSIRKANAGKVVYVDFWATWCAPCVGEMPAANALKQCINDKNAVFVNICIDSPLDTWKYDVAKLGLTGSQYYCNKEQANALRKEFHIEAIPYHMLLNKSGDIVEAGNHLRASDPLTEKKINFLLHSNGAANADNMATIVPAVKP